MLKLFNTIILISFCFVFSLQGANSASRDPAPIECSWQLQAHLKKIQKLPEARELIAKVQKDGPISIEALTSSLSQQFGAFWDADRRTIGVNAQRTEGAVIASILFELHNASITAKLDRLDYLASTGKIAKEQYVESVERLEYQNSINASNMAKKGIDAGLFPKTAFLPTYPTFTEHYQVQKQGGHSAWIAKTFDQLSPSRAAHWNYSN
jgi:hypothetical protein